ncbi:carbohydrate ABC transporter permease [Clostridium perfringens]|uniref:carbohydrate ABC transporter permease n=1 Tax=Clostridium perfringens TaxID=1502 RepID=UPI0024BD569F|nr:carbohydrate ABC transporter permease [Clostridium perfringens]
MLETIKQKRLQKKAEPKEEVNKFNAVSKKSNFLLNVLFAILAFLAIMPFVLVIAISLTNEQSLQLNGYRFIPEEWSLEAYKYIFSSGSQILTSYGVTITVTIVGTLIGLAIMSMYGYALSRKSFAYRKFFTKVIFVPMLFSGGMVASYLVVTRFLGLKNTIWALILPMCVSSFHIIILRTFFKTSVPDAIIESAKIDGASEWRLFLRIVLPISLPGIATIGLFLTLGYWNDWFNAMLYIDEPNLIPLQYLLIRLENSMEFLANNATSLGANAIEATKSMPKDTAKMAIVVISTLPIIFAYPFFQRYFVNGLTIGAVKE